MGTAIALDGLSKEYRKLLRKKTSALNNVSLAVKEGESFGFIGPNGAGKSTTIKILTGIIQSTAGHALLFGVPVHEYMARKSVGYVPESPYLYDYLTPLEILSMGAKVYGVTGAGLKQHCMYWLGRFGIAHVANKKIRSFSKGMTQRVALAHALAVKPRLLILDEPLSGLDPVGRKEVVDILQEYRQQGGTLFFSSHILQDVERLADRFGIIHKGVLRTVQTPAELVGEQQEFWVRVEGPQALTGAEQESPSRWKIRVAQEQVANVLGHVTATRQRLLAVEPAATLEAAFLRYVSGN